MSNTTLGQRLNGNGTNGNSSNGNHRPSKTRPKRKWRRILVLGVFLVGAYFGYDYYQRVQLQQLKDYQIEGLLAQTAKYDPIHMRLIDEKMRREIEGNKHPVYFSIYSTPTPSPQELKESDNITKRMAQEIVKKRMNNQ